MKAPPDHDFDLEQRPETYWPNTPNEATVLSRVHGTARRELARRLLEGDTPPPAGDVDFVLDEKVDDDDALHLWTRFHPSMLGGEFLPDYLPGEVEVVRIEMQSTTGDVIQVRARPIGERIAYRVVDEYETEHGDPETWAYAIEPSTSDEPLSLAGLIRLIDTARLTGAIAYDDERYDVGLIGGVLHGNYDATGDHDSMRRFFRVRSAFYPALEAYYDAVMQHWHDEHVRLFEDDNP